MEISSQTLGDVRILKALGAYGDVITPLSAAILRVLAEEPGAVACDLSAVVWGSGPNGEEGPSSLAQLGECVRSWPGTPVLMACPDARVRAALQRQQGGIHVVFTDGMAAALEGALGGSRRVERLALWPLHSAPGTARAFTRRIWQQWRLPGDSVSAMLVTSEQGQCHPLSRDLRSSTRRARIRPSHQCTRRCTPRASATPAHRGSCRRCRLADETHP